MKAKKEGNKEKQKEFTDLFHKLKEKIANLNKEKSVDKKEEKITKNLNKKQKLKEKFIDLKDEIDYLKNIELKALNKNELKELKNRIENIDSNITFEDSKYLTFKKFDIDKQINRIETKEQADKIGGYTKKLNDLCEFVALADISSYPKDLQKHIYDNYKKVYIKYPQIKYGTLKKADLKGDTYANNFAIGNIVTLNSKWYDDLPKLKKQYEQDVSKNWHPQGTNYNSIITHELGHALLEYITMNTGYTGTAIRNKICNKLKINKKDIDTYLSRYPNNSKDPPHEFFAEAFAEYMDSPNPRPLAVEFGKEINRILTDFKLN